MTRRELFGTVLAAFGLRHLVKSPAPAAALISPWSAYFVKEMLSDAKVFRHYDWKIETFENYQSPFSCPVTSASDLSVEPLKAVTASTPA